MSELPKQYNHRNISLQLLSYRPQQLSQTTWLSYVLLLQIQMVNNNTSSLTHLLFLIILLLSCFPTANTQTTLNVSISNLNINALTTYTYQITFSDTSIRNLLTINFPPQVTISNTTTVQINGSNLNQSQFTINQTTKSIVINKTISTAATIAISNVKNPPSAISTYSFTISSNNTNDNLSPSIYNTVNYAPGILQSCQYAFKGSTQQINSTLSVTFVLKDQILSGNNKATISYPIKWENSNTKSMTSEGASITCSYSINQSVFISTTCTYDSKNVYVIFSTTSTILSNTTMVVMIIGVNNPPTVQTTTSSSFKVATYDASGYMIDSLSNCIITDTIISEQAGSFSSSNLKINTVYNSPQINFTNAVPVTFQSGDTLEVYYPLNTLTCSSFLYLSRNTALSWTFSLTSNGTRYYNCSTPNDNTFSDTPLQLYLDCSVSLPPSAQPMTFIFLFKRNASFYLNLTSTLTAQASAFTNSSKFNITLSSTSAVSSSLYTFSIGLSQPLSGVGSIWIMLPSSINFANFLGTSGCTGTINSVSASIGSCGYSTNGSVTTLMIIFNLSSSIATGSILMLTVTGLSNPRYAYNSFGVGINTYHNASKPSSLVQYNSSITTITYTTYDTLNLAINPAAYNVYQSATANISYKNQLFLPTGSNFTLTFPSAITSLNFSSTIYINSTFTMINTSTVTNTSISFIYNSDLSIGSNVTIPVSLKTPTNLGNYGPITLRVVKNNSIYEQSSFLRLYVNQTSPIDVKINAPNSNGYATGASTTLQFTLSSYIAHSTPYFFFLITFPNDTTFNPVGPCSGACNTTYSMASNNVINITINNSYTSTSNFYNYSIALGTFKNPRNVGSSLTWSFQSFSKDGSQVGSGTSTFLVSLPNLLRGSLSLNDRYFRNNSNSVQLFLTLWNTLMSGDYLLIQFGIDTYTSPTKNVSCPLLNCSVSNQSTSNVLVVIVTPNVNQLSVNSISLQISGLVSSDTSIYNQITYFNISSFTKNGNLIDQGSLSYNVSCGEKASYSCRQCYSNGSCISCYTNLGMNILNDRCVFNCTSESQFQNFNQSGTCKACINDCYTCFNETYCRTCINNYYYYSNYSCLASCPTEGGYYPSTISGMVYCLGCYDQNLCQSCVNSSSNGCTKCFVGVLERGACLSACSDNNYYISSNSMCLACDISCNGCTGPSINNCKTCNYGYYNYSNYCITKCPNGTVIILYMQSCGCEGMCTTCSATSTYCLTCKNDTNNQQLFAYQGQCISSCPLYSYMVGNQCNSCGFGCYNCTVDTCFNCDADKYSHQNKCYQDCNSVGLQFDSSVSSDGKKVCILCPSGCDTCTGIVCQSCLANYSLQNSTCMSICLVLGNCDSPIPDKILPLPGIISLAAWSIIVIILKLLIKKIYAPFSLLFGFSLIQLFIIIAAISTINKLPSQSNSTSIGRLLLGMDYSYRLTVRSLLIAALAINYITNVLYLIIFCKYMRPLILVPRQIDYIVNGAILSIATITNYRFGVVAYSKMFPKPQIRVDNSSRLTPINYLLITTIILDILPLVASIIIVYKQQVLTNIFMLGVDLLVILGINVAVSILTVALPKAENYYDQQIKKEAAEQDFNCTEQDINEKNKSFNKLNASNPNLHNQHDSLANKQLMTDNNTIKVGSNQHEFDISSEQSNPPLNPIMPASSRKVEGNSNLAATLVNQNSENEANDIDELIQFQKNGSLVKQSKIRKNLSTKKGNSPQSARKYEDLQDHLQKKIIEKAVNYSKQKAQSTMRTISYSTPQVQASSHKLNIKNTQNSISEIDETEIVPVITKPNKHTTPIKTKSNNRNLSNSKNGPTKVTKGQNQVSKKKLQKSDNKLNIKDQKKIPDLEQEDKPPKQNDDLDLILESKIKNSKFIDTKNQQITKQHDKSEDISPAWFNNKNQRIDLSKLQSLQ